MSKRIFLLLFVGFTAVMVSLPSRALFAQAKQGQARLDSLLAEVLRIKEDTNGVKLIASISFMYPTINPDEGLKWAARELVLAQKLGWKKGEIKAYNDFGNNYFFKGAFPDALESYFKGLHVAEAQGDKERIGVVSGNIGNIYGRQEDYSKALEYYFKSLTIAKERGDKPRMQSALSNIGVVYSKQGKNDDALEYKKKALVIAEELNDKRNIIISTGNIGATYADQKQYNAALAYQFKSLRAAEEIGDKNGIALSLGNIGAAYQNIAADSIAPKPDSLVPPTREANLAKAIEYMNKNITAFREGGFKQFIPEATQNLSDAFEVQGDYKAALTAYKESIAIRDTLFNKENDAKLIRTEEGYKLSRAADSIKLEGQKQALRIEQAAQFAVLHREYERKQALAKTEEERQQLQYEEARKSQQITATFRQKEADADATHARAAALAKTEEERKAALAALAARRQKNLLLASLGGGVLLFFIGGLAFRAYRQRRASNLIIAQEREKSEALLRNILPAEVAAELKQEGHSTARQYEAVSVLFTDFVNFTGTAEQLSPQALVQELHECFSDFDAIMERHGLEKIKTIGDAYMAVSGLPHRDPNHAQKAVKAALDILAFMEDRKKRERVFGIRIGIHSGPVVAGIVGVKKFAYDIWGDTVNTASRMESASEPGRINISEATYQLVKKDFPVISRGAVAAKGKGAVDMYFVADAVPAAAL